MSDEARLWSLVIVVAALLLVGTGFMGYSCSQQQRECRAQVFSECVKAGRNKCADSAGRTCDGTSVSR